MYQLTKDVFIASLLAQSRFLYGSDYSDLLSVPHLASCYALYMRAFEQTKGLGRSCIRIFLQKDCPQCVCWYPAIYLEQLCITCRDISISKQSGIPQHAHSCACKPITLIGKSYFLPSSFSGGILFGSQGLMSSLPSPQGSPALGSLQFCDAPQDWSLAKNDAWLLGVIHARHEIYLQINNQGGMQDPALVDLAQSRSDTLNFFKNPLPWIWDVENSRFRVTGREIILLLDCGYAPRRLEEPIQQDKIVYLGFYSIYDSSQESIRFEKFQKIIEAFNVFGPIPLLKTLHFVGWFSDEALQCAITQYQSESEKAMSRLCRKRAHSNPNVSL